MYSDLIRVPQSILFGFPLIRQVLYLLVTFIYIFTLDFPWLDLEWELFTQTVRIALTVEHSLLEHWIGLEQPPQLPSTPQR
jgi:hypothetical protein